MIPHAWGFASIMIRYINILFLLDLIIIHILSWSSFDRQQFLFYDCAHASFLLTCALDSRIEAYHYISCLFWRVHPAQSGRFCGCFFFFYLFQKIFWGIYVSGNILVYVFDYLNFSFWCCFLTSVLETIYLVRSWKLGFCISSRQSCWRITVIH